MMIAEDQWGLMDELVEEETHYYDFGRENHFIITYNADNFVPEKGG